MFDGGVLINVLGRLQVKRISFFSYYDHGINKQLGDLYVKIYKLTVFIYTYT